MVVLVSSVDIGLTNSGLKMLRIIPNRQEQHPIMRLELHVGRQSKPEPKNGFKTITRKPNNKHATVDSETVFTELEICFEHLTVLVRITRWACKISNRC